MTVHFNNLPAELREVIWRAALQDVDDQRCLIPFTHQWFGPSTPKDTDKKATWKQIKTPLPSSTYPPAMIYVNREARAVAQAWAVSQGVCVVQTTKKETLFVRNGNVSRDLVYLSELDCLNIGVLHNDTVFSTDDIAAIAVPGWIRRDLLKDVLDKFRGVKEVYMIQGEPKWTKWSFRSNEQAADVASPRWEVKQPVEVSTCAGTDGQPIKRRVYSVLGDWGRKDGVVVMDGQVGIAA